MNSDQRRKILVIDPSRLAPDILIMATVMFMLRSEGTQVYE
jgi:hypothetical protein